MAAERAAAVFLDRDGTLVYPRIYPSHPRELRLRPRLGPVLRSLQQAGFRIVIVTNQSGIARGLFRTADLERLHVNLAKRLRRQVLPAGLIDHDSAELREGRSARLVVSQAAG